MANFEILNVNSHRHMRVKKVFGAEFGHSLGCISLAPGEIVEAQKEYPILFRKNPENGQFVTVALLGFEDTENLFLTEDQKWDAAYVPSGVARGPFAIAIGPDNQLQIGFNSGDARISQSEGEPLFLEDGQPAQLLRSIRENLAALNDGLAQTEAMIRAYTEAGLIQPMSFQAQFANGEAIEFKGAYCVDTDKLGQLNAAQLSELNKDGFLALAYFMAASVGNIKKLIALKNKRIELK